MPGGETLCSGEMGVLQAALVMVARKLILLLLCRREKALDEPGLFFLRIMHMFAF